MPTLALILIAGIWAAFLLPSLLDGRRHAPISTTRNFARSQSLLASVATPEARDAMQRRRAATRRSRILLSIALAAVGSLVMAIVQGSTTWLAVTIAFDLAFAGYVTLLLHVRQQVPRRAAVVPLRVVRDTDPHESSVRVVAGL